MKMQNVLMLPLLLAATGFAGAALAQSALPQCANLPEGVDRLDCTCPPEVHNGPVWGSDPYTADSSICRAARHAGVITEGGGPVAVLRVAGQTSYQGSEKHGITTDSWGAFGSSITFAPQVPPLADCGNSLPQLRGEKTCLCPPASGPGKPIWGANPYTGDSDICTAARHAGVIGTAGGPVLARRVAGQDRYDAAIRNGVASSSWGHFEDSLMVANAGATSDEPQALACFGFPVNAAFVTCHCGPKDGLAGAVWGAGPYTLDSDLCTAARHAGAIGSGGGQVTALRVTGLDSYASSDRNGVLTKSWGAAAASLVFDANRQP